MALVALLAVATAATSDPTRPRGKCNPEIVDTDWRTLRRITSVPDPRVLPGDNADANKTLDGLYHEVVCRLAAADGPLTLFVVGDSTMATQLAHIHFAIRWEVERQSLAGTAKQLTSCTTPCSELPPDTVSYGDISNFNLDECFLEAGEAIDHGLYQNNGSAPGPPISRPCPLEMPSWLADHTARLAASCPQASWRLVGCVPPSAANPYRSCPLSPAGRS